MLLPLSSTPARGSAAPAAPVWQAMQRPCCPPRPRTRAAAAAHLCHRAIGVGRARPALLYERLGSCDSWLRHQPLPPLLQRMLRPARRHICRPCHALLRAKPRQHCCPARLLDAAADELLTGRLRHAQAPHSEVVVCGADAGGDLAHAEARALQFDWLLDRVSRMGIAPGRAELPHTPTPLVPSAAGGRSSGSTCSPAHHQTPLHGG